MEYAAVCSLCLCR